jgi:hypothetical protein
MYNVIEYIKRKYFNAVEQLQHNKDSLLEDVLTISITEVLNRKHQLYSREMIVDEYFRDIMLQFPTEHFYKLLAENVEHFISRAPQIRGVVDKKHKEMYEQIKALSPHFVN